MELKLQTNIQSIVSALLLIVPYGIETILLQLPNLFLQSFNRTLWN